jgi:hypothetical protein
LIPKYLKKNIHCFLFTSEDRIRNGSKKLMKARAITQQGRLDTFFSVSRTVSTTKPIAKKAVCSSFNQKQQFDFF